MSMAYTEIGKNPFSTCCPIVITPTLTDDKPKKQRNLVKHWQRMNKGAYKQNRKGNL